MTILCVLCIHVMMMTTMIKMMMMMTTMIKMMMMMTTTTTWICIERTERWSHEEGVCSDPIEGEHEDASWCSTSIEHRRPSSRHPIPVHQPYVIWATDCYHHGRIQQAYCAGVHTIQAVATHHLSIHPSIHLLHASIHPSISEIVMDRWIVRCMDVVYWWAEWQIQ